MVAGLEAQRTLRELAALEEPMVAAAAALEG
jgi:hypothetical protein